jgi:hypothetical protein
VALDLFDRLRLREPFALAFEALGYEGEAAWRVAARIKVVLLTGAGVGRAEAAEEAEAVEGERVTLAPALWLDPDLRWLTGVHTAEGHEYLVRERYEELLWWLLMPSLLRLAGETVPSLVKAHRAAVRAMSVSIEAALETAEAASYRVDLLLGPAEESAAESAEAAIEPEAAETPLPVEEKEPDDRVIAEAAAEATEIESAVELQPSPGEEAEPDEPMIEPVAEAVTEPETETVVDSVEAAAVAEEISSPTEPSEQPESIEAKIEELAEVVPEPEAVLEGEPSSSEVAEPGELEIEAAVKAEPEAAEPETEAAGESIPEVETESAQAVKLETIAEDASSPFELPEVAEAGIQNEEAGEVKAAPAEWNLSQIEPFEPAAPKIEFTAKPVRED